jgi:RNase H-like domain found in reverse transcriptase
MEGRGVLYLSRIREGKKFVKFSSITLNEREAKFLQPKRELYGLKHALQASEYLLLGCRKLVVETDVKYIHGMLNHPEMGLNATITRWIEKVLMFHFELRHVPGKTFGPDGLSHRDKQEGDEEYPDDEDAGKINELPKMTMPEGVEPPLKLEEFRDEIDSQRGYLLDLAKSVNCFSKELETARCQGGLEKKVMDEYIAKDMNATKVTQFTSQHILPDVNEADDTIEYPESQHTKGGMMQDERLPLVERWLQEPFVRPMGMDDDEYKKFV